MSLMLSVPNFSARDSADTELQPSKVKQWLEELPLLNVAETSRKLFSTLTMHNRVAFDHGQRLQLLELFRHPVNQISLELTKQYIGLALPLSEKHKTIAEQNLQLQMEMANGYKRIVLEAAADPAGQGKKPVDQALAIQRAIRHLTMVLAVSYQSYSPWPPGAWKEIHALFTQAESLRLTHTGVEDPLIKAVPHCSVDHAYKQALLLGLSDPYHLPPRMLDRIHHYLDRWAPLAQLTAVTQAYSPTCQFLIDPESDRAGIANAIGSMPERTGRYRLLHTVELARQVHAQLTQLMGGQPPPPEGLKEKFFVENGQDLLKRLISAWGVNPQRSFRRSHRDDQRVEMAINLDAVNYWINGGKQFVVSSTFVGPIPQRAHIGLERNKLKNIMLPGKEFSTWDVNDESAGGLSLSKTGNIGLQVYVGDLVITRTPGEGNPWSIGVIRWVKSTGASSIEIGIQHLAPTAEPVVIKTVDEDDKESDFLPALLLPEIKPLKQPQSLITNRGVCRPDVQIYMDNGCRLYKLVSTSLVETSQAFEQFQFEVLNA
jgi:cyclic-di-GMP-binding protein